MARWMKPLFLLSTKLSYAGEALFQQALTSAGWRQHDFEIGYAEATDIASGGSRFIVAFGDGAAGACLDSWERGWSQDRRGYVWQGSAGGKVLTTLDPEACTLRQDPSGINGMLLVADLERAKREANRARLHLSRREVRIIDSRTAAPVLDWSAVACDIECSDSQTLLCIGFAPSSTLAYVFVGEALPLALEIVANPAISKTFQNGQFDAYFLATRCSTRVAGWTDDCMIAWHALWPEIAGKGRSKSKRTRKSLAFLASLYTESPEWWKDYSGDEAAMYELNGRDCCVTFEIMENLRQEIEEQNVEAIYRHEMSMMPVLVAIQERGLCVNEQARTAAITELNQRSAAAVNQLRRLAEPLLRERSANITKPHLFFGTKRCACCNGGASKAKACWSCAGLAGPARKRDNVTLGPCVPCGGAGRFDTFDFNPSSTQQRLELFTNVCGLPRRYDAGSPICDEKTIKGWLASCA